MLTGAQIVIKSLESLGVKTTFGYIGNYIMPVFDELKHSNIPLIATASEVGATFAADGYSRSSGDIGVVLTTSGPGATNLITGIATAYMDSIPMVAITANVPRAKLGKDSFQEVDITGIATPVTKYSHIVSDINSLEYDIKKAFAIANSGRKAPVLIDIPHDILYLECEYKDLVVNCDALPEATLDSIKSASDLINSAKNIGILVGGGATGAITNINELSKRLGAPIFATMRAVGCTDSPNFVGMVGMSAPASHNKMLQQCELIIAVGTRFSDRTFVKIGKNQQFIHIDIDMSELGKVVLSKIDICGDANNTIEKMLPFILIRNNEVALLPSSSRKNKLQRLCAIVNDCLHDNIILATDVGSHQVAMLNAISTKNVDEMLSSTGLGTMGYGLGACIGAGVATKKTCILVSGDGSFNMSYHELVTAVNLGLNIVGVIANNSTLMMIKDIQKNKYDKRYFAIDTPKINYALFAKSMGAKGVNCSINTAKKHITHAIINGGVTIINVNVR
ncbi:MAG: thiamine pyrophosphate-binding protein [Bacillota bacterium]